MNITTFSFFLIKYDKLRRPQFSVLTISPHFFNNFRIFSVSCLSSEGDVSCLAITVCRINSYLIFNKSEDILL